MTVGEPSGTAHLPRRPTWDCARCEAPWPCAPAKVELAEEYGDQRSALVVYLALQMIDAIDDMAASNVMGATDLYMRFVGWAPRRSHRQG